MTKVQLAATKAMGGKKGNKDFNTRVVDIIIFPLTFPIVKAMETLVKWCVSCIPIAFINDKTKGFFPMVYCHSKIQNLNCLWK